MKQIIYKGKIDGEFNGFDDNRLFEMANGTFWIQSDYHYWYHYAYRPDVLITEDGGRYSLSVAGQSITVSKIDNVIKSRIDHEIAERNAQPTYKLINGQTWQQTTNVCLNINGNRPEVTIYPVNGSFTMFVLGKEVKVQRM